MTTTTTLVIATLGSHDGSALKRRMVLIPRQWRRFVRAAVDIFIAGAAAVFISVNDEPVFARERSATREAVQKRPAGSLWTAERVADRVGSTETRIELRVSGTKSEAWNRWIFPRFHAENFVPETRSEIRVEVLPECKTPVYHVGNAPTQGYKENKAT